MLKTRIIDLFVAEEDAIGHSQGTNSWQLKFYERKLGEIWLRGRPNGVRSREKTLTLTSANLHHHERKPYSS